MTADLFPETKVRPPTRKELLADNRAFVDLVGELVHTVRNTADKSCCLCGAPQGTPPFGRTLRRSPESFGQGRLRGAPTGKACPVTIDRPARA